MIQILILTIRIIHHIFLFLKKYFLLFKVCHFIVLFHIFFQKFLPIYHQIHFSQQKNIIYFILNYFEFIIFQLIKIPFHFNTIVV